MEQPGETRVVTFTAPCLGLLADWFLFRSALLAGSRELMGFALLFLRVPTSLPSSLIGSLRLLYWASQVLK